MYVCVYIYTCLQQFFYYVSEPWLHGLQICPFLPFSFQHPDNFTKQTIKVRFGLLMLKEIKKL